MDFLWLDFRYALRRLRQSPGFTAIAVLTLALGIGANNAIFTVVNAVLLHPITQVEDAGRLVSVFTTDARNRNGGAIPATSEPNFEDFRATNHVFSGIFASQGNGVNLGSGGEPEPVNADLVSGNYFDLLGVRPMLGRGFLPEEDSTPGGHPVVVMNYALWQRRFGADRGLVGKSILLNGQQFTVIGVTPRGFNGTGALGGPDLWIPMAMHEQIQVGFMKDNFHERRFLAWNAIGRLKPGVTLEQAQAEMQTIARQLESEYPVPNKGRNVQLIPLMQSTLPPQFREVLLKASAVLMSVVGMVLLIACANLGNLLLARSLGRYREIAVRMALGATRWRLVTQLMVENLVLALLGGAAAFAVGYWARTLLIAHRPPGLANTNIEIHLDGYVVAFTLGIAVLTGVVFGLAPAVRASRPDLATELKERSAVDGGAGGGFTLRNSLVVMEVTLSLIALAGAGLFFVSLRNAQRIDVGLDVDHLAIASFNVGSQGYTPARAQQFYREVQESISGLPGVKGVTLASNVPLLAGGFLRSVYPEGEEQTQGRNGVLVAIDSIAPRYFETTGIALQSGRTFADSDNEMAPPVAIVNRAFAQRFWPGQDAINKRFKFFGDKQLTTVVGIAADAKYNTVGEEPTPYLYQPSAQAYSPQMTVFVRTSGAPSLVLDGVRNQLRSMEPHMPVTNVWTMNEVMDQALWAPRTAAELLGVFALLAVALATTGIYGVMSYSVRRRVREIGVRMALGARPADVLRLVLGEGMTLVVIGLIAGFAFSFVLGRLVASLLFGVAGANVVLFMVLSLGLAAVALLAGYVPAHRATRVDPMVALRYE